MKEAEKKARELYPEKGEGLGADVARAMQKAFIEGAKWQSQNK